MTLGPVDRVGLLYISETLDSKEFILLILYFSSWEPADLDNFPLNLFQFTLQSTR